MKKLCLALLLTAMCGGVIGLRADDTTKKEKKEMSKDRPADGSDVTVVGMMARKPESAKSDVVCLLLAGQGKKGDLRWNLLATGELATKIEAMRQNGDKVKVSGKVKGEDLEVASIDRVVYMKK